MNFRSLAFRLSAWYAILLTITFVSVALAGVYGLQHYMRLNLRDSLKRRSEQVELILRHAPEPQSPADLSRDIETRIAPEFNNRFIRITRMPADVIYTSGPPSDRSFDPAVVPRTGVSLGAPHAVENVTISGPLRLMVRGVFVTAPPVTYFVEVGASMEPAQAVRDQLLNLLALLLPVLIVCAVAGGYVLVNRALRPVDRMSQTAERMSLQNVALQLPVVPSGDALERLSVALNSMLGRLRDSVQTSRRFLADASHELRTPLTVIKGELQELAGAGGEIPDDLSERLGSVLEEVGRLEHLVSSLLVLSRFDAGEIPRVLTEVDLAELVQSTAEQMRLMAEDRGIDIRVTNQGQALVHGDPGRLKQVIVNLLDNAIRFTPRGGVVALKTTVKDSQHTLEVSDTGVGIPVEAIPRVFDRFFRADDARSREDGGAGLGLAIVRSICAVYQANIEVESQVGQGSSFRVSFAAKPQVRSNPFDDTPAALGPLGDAVTLPSVRPAHNG